MADIQVNSRKARTPESWIRRGQRYDKKGDPKRAMHCYFNAFDADPRNVDALKHLSKKLIELAERSTAIKVLERAVEANPEDVDVLHLLGGLALEMRMPDQALGFYRIAVSLDPDDPVGYNNIATVLREKEEFDQGIALLQEVIPQFPEAAFLWNTLASLVTSRDGYEAGLPFYEEALRLDPRQVMALSNLARANETIGRYEKAIEIAQRATKLDTNLTEPHFIMGISYLAMGDLARGWEEYEWRQHSRRTGALHFPIEAPRWNGEDIADKTIIVYAEQGIGDEILFASCLPEIMARAGQCIIGCDSRLIPLFQRSFPGAIIGGYRDFYYGGARYRDLPFLREKGIEPDCYIEIGSLPKFFRQDFADFPDPPGGFLEPDAERVDFWRERLAALGPGMKVGISWRSGMQNTERNAHYTLLDEWGPIFAVPGVTFVNVQYGDCEDELRAAEKQFGVTIHRWDDLDIKNDIDDVTALTAALDLSIGPTTQPAATAFSVATEVWLLARRRPWWCLGLEDRTRFGPSRVFLYDEEAGWRPPIARAAEELAARAGHGD